MELQISTKIFNEAYKRDLHDFNTRYAVFYGGSGSGKSHYVVQKLVIKALMDKRKVLALRKVGATTKDSTFQLLKDTIAFFGIYDNCKINKSEYSIELPNGSLFLCKGLDDPEKIKSIAGLTDIWLEESTEFNQDDFNQLDLRLRHPDAKNQQIICSFNPVSKNNWCYKLFFEPTKDKDILDFRKNTKVIHTTYLDNKFLPEAYAKTLHQLKGTNPTYYAIYCLGEFGSLGKTIFTNWKVEDFDPYKIPKAKLAMGADVGFNDPNTQVAILLQEEQKRVYVFKEYYEVEQTLSDFAKGVAEFTVNPKYPLYMDNSAKTVIESLKKDYHLNVQPCKKAGVLEGITRLQSYEIVVHPSCVNFKRELENYSWKKDKKTNEYIDEPLADGNDHLIDACVYALNSLFTEGSVKVGTKRLLGI